MVFNSDPRKNKLIYIKEEVLSGMNEREELNLRDFDDAHNEKIIQSIENERNSRTSVAAAAIATTIYMLVNTLFYGMFAYRGGEIEVSVTNFVIDLIVIIFIINASVDERDKDRFLSILFGSIMFFAGNYLIKSFILFPLIVNIFDMN